MCLGAGPGGWRFLLADGGESRPPGPSAIDLLGTAEAAPIRAGLPPLAAAGGGAA